MLESLFNKFKELFLIPESPLPRPAIKPNLKSFNPLPSPPPRAVSIEKSGRGLYGQLVLGGGGGVHSVVYQTVFHVAPPCTQDVN